MEMDIHFCMAVKMVSKDCSGSSFAKRMLALSRRDMFIMKGERSWAEAILSAICTKSTTFE